MPPRKDSEAGFTLLELMVAGALVGILAAIAVPSYTTYIDRTNQRRAEADLAALSLQLARWELNNGSLPVSLSAAGLGAPTDPWGNAYVYRRMDDANPGAARKDSKLNPINTDFDLFSAGQDGEWTTALTAASSRDDVIRAGNGQFFGTADDY